MNDQRKTKKQLADEISSLNERLGLFQGLVENSPDAIAMTDAHGGITYFSPGAEALSGFTVEEVSSMRASDFYPGGVEEAREVMELLRAEGQLRNYQQAFIAKDGSLIEVYASYSLLHDANGEVSGTLAVWKDITEQKRAEEALRRSEERSDALYQVSNLLAGAHDTNEVLDLIVNEATRLLGATGSWIRLLEGDVLVPRAATKSAAAYLAEVTEANPTLVVEAGTSVMGHVMTTKKPWVISDARKDRFITPAARLYTEKYGFHGTAVVPLLAGDRSLGALSVVDERIRLFTEDEVSLLTAFADQAALALEKARLLNEAETERERADSLYRISNLLAGAHDTEEVLDLIVNEAARLIGTEYVAIRLLEGNALVPSAATEPMKDYFARSAETFPRFIVEEGATVPGHVMATKKPMYGEEVERLATPEGLRNAQEHGFQTSSVIVVPLLANDQSIGVITVFDTRIRQIREDEVTLLAAFADQAALALEKARLLNEAETERERSDALYQISNRLAGAHDTEEVLDLIVNEAARLVGAKAGYIRLLEGGVGVPAAVTASAAGYLAEITEASPSVTVEEGASVPGHVMATMTPLVIDNVTTSERVAPASRPVAVKHGFYGMAIVPMVVNAQPIGVLAVFDGSVRLFTDDEVSLLAAFADQASLAIEKARLLKEAETERERADSLYRVSNLLAGAHDTDEVLELVVNEAARLLGATASWIRLLEEGVLVPGAATESAAAFLVDVAELLPSVPVGEGTNIQGNVMATKTPFVGDPLGEGLLMPGMEPIFQKYGFRGTAAVPLLANHQPLGVLMVTDTRVRRFTDDEVSLLTAFADQAALALEKARLLNEAETERERLSALNEVGNRLASVHETEEVLDLIVNEAARLLGSHSAYIRLLEDGELVPGAATDSVKGYLSGADASLNLKEGSGILGQVMATLEPHWIEDAAEDPELNPETRKRLVEYGFHGAVALPLRANGVSIGVLNVLDNKKRVFTADEMALASGLADQASLALEKARLLSEAEARERQATQLYEVTTQLASNHDLDSVLDLIVQQAAELTDGDGGAIFEYDPARGGLFVASLYSSRGDVDPDLRDIFLLPGEGSAGRAYAERRTVWSGNPVGDSSIIYPDDHTEELVNQMGSVPGQAGVISAPIMIRGEVYAVLNVIYDQGREFTGEEINLVQNLADSAAVAINNARFIEEIQHQSAELAATNQELEAFSYSVSHDLRAPLRGIDGFSQALLNEYSDVLDEQAQHYLERVRTGSERMGQLIDDLLALSQVTRGEMRRENVDLSDLARTIVTGLQERDSQRQVEFVIQDGVVLNGDTRLLRVALENLLGNAWKYTGKNQEARIEFGLTEDDGNRTCFVRDDGSGFDMAYADRLFGAFQRLHDASEFEGSGIGLATVQRIINRHGGQIWAESAPDQGATFYFTLH